MNDEVGVGPAALFKFAPVFRGEMPAAAQCPPCGLGFSLSSAPFRLSDRHWKIWTLNRAGTRDVGRRLSFELKPPLR